MNPARAETPARELARENLLQLGALVTAFIASRVLWILYFPRSSQYWEEGYRWLAAHEIAQGASLPFLDYQADHYQGGSLVVIGVAALLAKLGLSSFAAIKVVALGFSTATLAALYGMTLRSCGRRAALLCGLLYLAGPPLVAFWGTIAMGFHSESTLLSLLATASFLVLAQSPESERRQWIAGGALTSLAIWFAPIAAVPLAACAAAWPLVARGAKRIDVVGTAIGLTLGALPWLVYNATHGFAGVLRAFQVFGLSESADRWQEQSLFERAVEFFVRAPSEGLFAPSRDLVGDATQSALWIAIWVPAGLALAFSLRHSFRALRNRRHGISACDAAEITFTLQVLFFAFAYLASEFTLDPVPTPISYRLFVPAAVSLIGIVAIAAARGLERPGWQGHGVALATALGLLACGGTTLRFAASHLEGGTPLSLVGAGPTRGRLLQSKHGLDLRGAVASARATPDDQSSKVLVGIGWGLQAYAEQTGDVAGITNALASVDERERLAVEAGIRFGIGLRLPALRAAVSAADLARDRRALARITALGEAIKRPIVRESIDRFEQ